MCNGDEADLSFHANSKKSIFLFVYICFWQDNEQE
jgi:hypothetical protein